MGSRSRRNPDRAKPEDAPAPKETIAVAGAVPGSVIVVFAEEFRCRIGKHPAIDGALLDLGFRIPGGAITVRLPLAAGGPIHAELGTLLSQADAAGVDRVARSGIHLPNAATNLAAEAALHNAMKKGPTST